MTTFAEEREVLGDTNAQDLHDFTHLQLGADFVVGKTELWFANGIALHERVDDPEKKAELLALRQDMIDRLKDVLGV